MQQGAYISGAAHGVLILWALVAGFFLSAGDPLPVETMEVSVLTAEEFAALTVPDLPQPAEVAVPEPVVPPPPPPEPAPSQAAAEAEIAPEPAPAPEPPAPPPVEAVPDQPITPDQPPTPPEADRVAPDIAPAPPEEAEIAPEVTPEVSPDAEAQQVAEEAPATAPEEAATEIVTEAETPASAAPVRSIRPMARPRTLPAAPTPDPAPETDPDPAPDPADAIADALAEAVAVPDTPPVPAGPPLTSGERDVFRVAVQDCWVVDVGSQAADVTVTIAFSLDQTGKVQGDSLRLLSAEGGEGAAANSAFNAARRAILRCQKGGYPLPPDKYDHWRDVEMTFNPTNMRIK